MTWAPEILMAIAGQLLAAGAIYGGIRADLKSHGERLKRVEEEAERAHARVDQLMMKGHP